MQLGPVCSTPQRSAGVEVGTRVVAGLSALQVTIQCFIDSSRDVHKVLTKLDYQCVAQIYQ